jgi:hypothetical protein
MYNSLSIIYKNQVLLKEYSERMITDTIARFQGQTTDQPQDIRKKILDFEAVKDSDRFKKLVPALLPNIKTIGDIDLYSYNDITAILNWFESSGQQKQKITYQPQEAPGVMPERVAKGDEVGLEIHIAHNYEQAKYLTVDHFGRCYGYCVKYKSYWSGYRHRDKQTFYFVYDNSKPENDVNHILVIRPVEQQNRDLSNPQVGGPQYVYKVTDGRNNDRTLSWEGVVALQPKLSTIKDVFVSKPLTPLEAVARETADVPPDRFRSLNYQAKAQYIAMGNRIYEKDYTLLDKDLQNDYINAQDMWENISIIEPGKAETIVSGMYGLLWPFAIPGDPEETFGRTNTGRKFLGLYISLKLEKSGGDFSSLLDVHPVIKNGAGGARKRYLFLLERNKSKILTISTKCAVANIMSILNLKNSNIKELKNYFKNENVGIFDVLSPEFQKHFIVEKKMQISSKEFTALNREVQEIYLQEWFKRGGEYVVRVSSESDINDVTESVERNSLLCPYFDVDLEQTNKLLDQCSTLEEFVDLHPAFKGVEGNIKKLFVDNIKKYSETYEED